MKKEVIQAVTGQIINMLDNNILGEQGNEPFEGWCAEGEVFDDGFDDRNEAFIHECMRLVKEVSPLIDKLTYEFLNIQNKQQ